MTHCGQNGFHQVLESLVNKCLFLSLEFRGPLIIWEIIVKVLLYFNLDQFLSLQNSFVDRVEVHHEHKGVEWTIKKLILLLSIKLWHKNTLLNLFLKMLRHFLCLFLVAPSFAFQATIQSQLFEFEGILLFYVVKLFSRLLVAKDRYIGLRLSFMARTHLQWRSLRAYRDSGHWMVIVARLVFILSTFLQLL